VKGERRVTLTLEESGVLCYLVMAEIGPYVLGRKTPTNKIEAAIFRRRVALYEKLAAANAELMMEI
jgi:hypothetical protein